ncbi:MAG: PAS domain-containing sensor histidine kinase [Alphaproteobacteria bacterium]
MNPNHPKNFWSFAKPLKSTFPKFKRGYLRHNISVLFFVFALALTVITLSILSGFSVFSTNPKLVLYLLVTDVVVFLVLGILIARKLVELWIERKKGLAGSKIHVRLSLIFGGLAIAPAITMTLLSVLFFHFGVQDWFSDRVKSALGESVLVAESYLEEHKRTVSKDASLMAYDLDKQFGHLRTRQEVDNYLTIMSSLRSLSEAIVFDANQNLLGRSNLTFALQFEPIPLKSIEDAKNGKVSLLSSSHKDRMRALVSLPSNPNIYLFVGRSVDPTVLKHLQKAQTIFDEYGILEGKRLGFEIVVIGLFFVIALLLLLVSIWIGLVMARKLVQPIKELIEASEQIRSGNLNINLPERDQKDELHILSRSFNRMASRLKTQQTELLEANKVLDERRRFIESTLSGVSSGVIGLDLAEKIVYPNQMASKLIGLNLQHYKGVKIGQLIPEMKPILKKASKSQLAITEGHMQINLKGNLRVFTVHIVPEKTDTEVRGYVLTLDDITNLIAAQKQAAWSDVAQRVAHEIKNPLTPIHLSAERLKRKYFKEIKTDPDSFLECVDIITRQVNFIGHLVSEFSAFARMPSPILSRNNLNHICEQSVSLQKNAHSLINFTIDLPKEPVYMQCDEEQISQALSNLLKNSSEAISENEHPKANPQINLSIETTENSIEIFIKDNGPGFPLDQKDKLLDPYTTTRSKGTGLGLAIVQKIIEDHKGQIYLLNQTKSSGAIVRLVFPKSNKP